MIRINIHNVEDVIFKNNEIWKQLPEIRYLRDQWRMSKISPIFKAMAKKSMIDFLNKVNLDQEKIISKQLGTSVTIDKLDYHLINNLDFHIDDAEFELSLISEELYSYFTTYRKGDRIYATFWR
jgi:hypothetical protein